MFLARTPIRNLLSTNARFLLATQARTFATFRKFTEDHEWLEVNTDTNQAKIGITNHAQSELGDIVHIDLPSVGDEFSSGDSVGAVESVKTAAEVLAPVDGEIVGVNEKLSDDPALVNQDAEGDGWIVEVKLNDSSAADGLMTEEEDKEFLSNL